MDVALKLLLETILLKIETLDGKHTDQLELSHQTNLDVNESRAEVAQLKGKIENSLKLSCPRDPEAFERAFDQSLKIRGISGSIENKKSFMYKMVIVNIFVSLVLGSIVIYKFILT